MKTYILPAIKLTALSMLLFMVVYPLVIFGVAQLSPNHGQGKLALKDGKVVGYANVGQKFNSDRYFWSRPSAVGYNAAGSGGSNKGPTNPDYLKSVQDNLDTFLVHHPYLTKSEVPSEMLTASGSGLDPDISPEAARVQVVRVAKARGIDPGQVNALVEQQIQKPLLSVFGPSHVNVLQLNIALDQLK